MPAYSLIELKLRRYFYLGHDYCIYVPPAIRTSFWNPKHHDDVTGVRIIGKIVKKNKTEEINSIVPIILKIKKEDKLLDDRLLIFTLAVCAKFNLKQCIKMVTDAYAAVSTICTDGLKLLMFVKFCSVANNILFDQGFLTSKSNSHGRGFIKAMTRWYLNRDPLLTIEHIVRNKRYCGWTHRDVMKLIHLKTDEPCRIMYIVYTLSGIEKVERLFGSKMKDVCIEDSDEIFENKQMKFIYNFLNQVENIKQMDDCSLRYEIELNRWGHEPEVIPREMLRNPTILTSLIMHLPLKTILDNTFFFAKNRLFCNSSSDVGLWEYILRFNNTNLLKKSKIHPIEPYIEYAKYSRTALNILKLQNNIMKKKENSVTELIDDKLKVLVKLQKTPDKEEIIIQSTVDNESESFSEKTQNQNQNDQKCSSSSENTLAETSCKENQKEKQNQSADITHHLSILNFNSQQNNAGSTEETIEDVNQSKDNDVNQNQFNTFFLIKPLPKIVDKLNKFLTEDLLRKTCEILNPFGVRIMIVYDNRLCMKQKMCACLQMLSVHEAITLITLSLIYPEKLENKPTVYGLNSNSSTSKEIEIDYNQPLTFAYLESILFKRPENRSNLVGSDHKMISQVHPHLALKWARENNKKFDVFVFMGTNNMNLRPLKKIIKGYQEFFKNPVKVIIFCLNGKHHEQINLGRENTLFIIGFDKNVGNLINSFIRGDF
uniref:SS-A/Ro ribonucleoprotein n=1 Tax=Melanaphis sacchari TaxID=742174 RepID=A0A2H8U049_9HEMI